MGLCLVYRNIDFGFLWLNTCSLLLGLYTFIRPWHLHQWHDFINKGTIYIHITVLAYSPNPGQCGGEEAATFFLYFSPMKNHPPRLYLRSGDASGGYGMQGLPSNTVDLGNVRGTLVSCYCYARFLCLEGEGSSPSTGMISGPSSASRFSCLLPYYPRLSVPGGRCSVINDIRLSWILL